MELLAIHPLLLTPLSSTHARAVPPHEGLAEALVLPTGVVQQLALGPELAGPAQVVLAQRHALALRLTPAQQTHLQFHHHLLLRSRHLRPLLRLLQTARLLHRLLRLLLLRDAFLRGVVTLALFPPSSPQLPPTHSLSDLLRIVSDFGRVTVPANDAWQKRPLFGNELEQRLGHLHLALLVHGRDVIPQHLLDRVERAAYL